MYHKINRSLVTPRRLLDRLRFRQCRSDISYFIRARTVRQRSLYHGELRLDGHRLQCYNLNLRCRLRVRTFSGHSIIGVLTPPLVFVGLVLALWAYKCLMMVMFQDKIIYMPSVPPFSRRETIATYQKSCGNVRWREEELKSSDGTRLALCITEHSRANNSTSTSQRVIILYFQG